MYACVHAMLICLPCRYHRTKFRSIAFDCSRTLLSLTILSSLERSSGDNPAIHTWSFTSWRLMPSVLHHNMLDSPWDIARTATGALIGRAKHGLALIAATLTLDLTERRC